RLLSVRVSRGARPVIPAALVQPPLGLQHIGRVRTLGGIAARTVKDLLRRGLARAVPAGDNLREGVLGAATGCLVGASRVGDPDEVECALDRGGLSVNDESGRRACGARCSFAVERDRGLFRSSRLRCRGNLFGGSLSFRSIKSKGACDAPLGCTRFTPLVR